MNTRKTNETFYQNNAVELNEEALAKVMGGCGNSGGYEQPWGQGWNGSDSNCDDGSDRRHHHCRGLLGNLLCDLL